MPKRWAGALAGCALAAILARTAGVVRAFLWLLYFIAPVTAFLQDHSLARPKDNGGSFQCDVYLFGAEAGADQGLVNISALTDGQDLSSPDGLVFCKATGICWLQTDGGAGTDVAHCMVLAATPGRLGDGGARTLSHSRADGRKLGVVTQVDKPATPDTLKRFLVEPQGSEATRLAETPDGKPIFVKSSTPVNRPGWSTWPTPPHTRAGGLPMPVTAPASARARPLS